MTVLSVVFALSELRTPEMVKTESFLFQATRKRPLSFILNPDHPRNYPWSIQTRKMALLYTKTFTPGNPIFSSTPCQHSDQRLVSIPCSVCTRCFICSDPVGSGKVLRFLEGKQSIHCHESCSELVDLSSAKINIDQESLSLQIAVKEFSHICELCDFLCHSENETFIFNLIEQKLWLHDHCLQKSSCHQCQKSTCLQVGRPLINNKKVYHEWCAPMICMFCAQATDEPLLKKVANRLNLKVYFYHQNCRDRGICGKCETEFGPVDNDNMRWSVSNGLVHVSCKTERCRICKKCLGTAGYRQSVGKDYYHHSCIEDVKCNTCQKGLGLIFTDNPDKGLLCSTCDTRICKLCKKLCGKDHETLMDGRQYHAVCIADQIKCHACDLYGGRKISGLERIPS